MLERDREDDGVALDATIQTLEQMLKVWTKQKLLATQAISNPRFLSYMASYDVASNICQARSPPRHWNAFSSRVS